MRGLSLLVGLLALTLMPHLADRFVYFPSRELDGGTPAAIGLAFEDVVLTSADGVRLHAWWVPAAQPRMTLLFLHGNGGNISHRLLKLAALSELDASVLLLDYRGYGRSDGTPSEAGTYADAQAAYDWLRARGVAVEDIVVYGESLGGPIAVDLAARNPVGRLVLESSPSSIAAVARWHYPWLPTDWLLTYRYDALARLPRVRAPVLLLHSPTDEIVPYAMAEELYAAAPGDKRLVPLAGGHNDAFAVAAPVYQAALRDFLR
ncbi:MAG: alpha/beta hydrolase [Deltaproteobacteria bacterium]|nr:alpha/beta hydrolase [Deltaproteobacteria bacterium]